MWGDLVDNKKVFRMYIFITHIFLMSLFSLSSSFVSAATKDSVEQVERTPFYIATALIGGVIILTLSYVSWKKYRAERKNKDKNTNS